MSHYMTALAMKQQGLKPATKIVLYWLADHHNGETGKCFPSLARLCKVTEMGKTALVGHLDTLEKLGFIKRIRKYDNNGSFKSTDYVLTLKDDTLVRNTDNPCSDFTPPLVRNADTNLVSNNLVSKPYTSSSSDDDETANLFERAYWSKYPKKVGKKAALKSFKAVMRQVDRGNVHYGEFKTGFEKYVSSMQGKDQQYIKHFATWLNGEHWTDEA